MAETMTRIKICGITNLRDAMTAANAGTDALGFVFAPSPRRIAPLDARAIIRELPPFINKVGVFANACRDEIISIIGRTGINAVQLHGNESPVECQEFAVPVIKRIKIDPDDTARSIKRKIENYDITTFLLDPGSGDGLTFDWTIARSLKRNIIIAGGLNLDNVSRVIRLLRPYGVDICSGVEKSKGIKDLRKMKRFIREVRKCSMP